MFWSFVLPFQITCVVLLAGLLIAICVVPASARIKTFGLGVLLSGFAFVPSCAAIDWATIPWRFGMFEYADFASADDRRMNFWMPPAATDILVNKGRNGYIATFHIDQASLESWFTSKWQESLDHGVNNWPADERIERADKQKLVGSVKKTKGLNWNPTGYGIIYNGPYADNWAGSTIYYDPTTSTALQKTADW